MRNQYLNRKYVLGGLVIFVGFVFLVQLFVIQVINPQYKLSANNNSRYRQVEYPGRGSILDRNGDVIVYNEAAYDVMVIPRQLVPFDTLELCTILDVSYDDLASSIQKARKYSSYRASILFPQLSARRYASLQEKLYKYPGIFVQPRAVRAYSQEIAPHVLGFLGATNKDDIKRDSYYSADDNLGVSGLEQEYEGVLRGEKGVKYLLVDVHSQIKGSYEEGRFDKMAIAGRSITTSIDAALQKYGEELMAHKKGSIVAIEPETGELLTLVSSPGFSLQDMVGRNRNSTFAYLQNDTLRPLFNRAVMSHYAPGSIFKIVQALVGLEIGVITPFTSFECDKDLIGCHEHPDPTNVKKAIQYSCNPYFYQVYKRIIQQGVYRNIFQDSEFGIGVWRDHVISFGLGVDLPVDIPNVRSGVIPDAAFYDRWYGQRRWAFSTIYSNCNGQGEVESIPMQIANLAAIIANRGYYYVPHFIKAIEGDETIPEVFTTRNYTKVRSEFFDVAVDAMYDAVWESGGTGWRARVPGIQVCGKTGTVENAQGEDHSGFFAFAPKDNPKIAIAVYVENAGGGGTWAAPIASLMMEKYLKGEVKQIEKEKSIKELIMY